MLSFTCPIGSTKEQLIAARSGCDGRQRQLQGEPSKPEPGSRKISLQSA